MSRFFLPRHARTHLPGGSDPLPLSDAGDIPWAIIDSTIAETINGNTTMTFSLASHNFNTNAPDVFSIRSGVQAFQGIQFLETGVYEVWYYVTAIKSSATSPETWLLTIVPGSNGGEQYPCEFTLAQSRAYGISTPNTSPVQGVWRLQAAYLIGIADVSDNPNLVIGVVNHDSTSITPGGNARIYAKRLSATLSDYSTFF